MIIIAQIIGALAIFFWVISVQMKEKKTILINQMIANILYTIQYSLLGVFSASSMNFTSALRSFVFYNYEKQNKTATKVWLIVFIGLVLTCGILTWDSMLSIIPITITLFYTIGAWIKDSKWMRIVFLIAAFIWIYYNYKVGAYICILGNMFEITSGIIALTRFKENKNVKVITYNNDNLKDSEVEEIVTRAKALIIDKDKNITLGYSEKSYQFPGGHLEKDETSKKCLIREVKEETGITLEESELEYFMRINHYTRNYRNTNKNRLNIIDYFLVKTDKKPNLEKTSYDKREKEGNYILKEVNINDIEKVLKENIEQNKINKLIVAEMIDVINEYKRRNNG